MKKNFFSTYDFETVKGYVSKVEQAGFEYPEAPADPREYTAQDTFRNEGIEVIVPLVEAEFVGPNYKGE